MSTKDFSDTAVLELGRERIGEFDRSRIPTIAFDQREAAEGATRLA